MYLPGLVTAMQSMAVEQTKIDKVVAALRECTDDDWATRFATGSAIAPTSFGGGDSAGTLAAHHDRAQQVMSETVRGVVSDLMAFAEGVHQAAGFIRDADDATAAGLIERRRAVEMLEDGWATSEGDAAYEQARNRGGRG